MADIRAELKALASPTVCSASSDTSHLRRLPEMTSQTRRYRRPTDHVTGERCARRQQQLRARQVAKPISTCTWSSSAAELNGLAAGPRDDAVFNRIERRHKLIEID